MASNPDSQPGLNLLSLDGGGITGLSTLLIIREIMLKFQGMSRETNRQSSMRPCDYFDMIAGTGTGAVSAVMLGRLHMTIDDAITSYNQLMKNVFSERKYTFVGGSGAYKTTTLEKELEDIVRQRTGDKDEPMLEREGNNRDRQCKVVVYAMSSYNMTSALPVAFRTYSTPSTAVCSCAIWQALRATTTHPEMFKSIEVDAEGTGVQDKFVRGGLGCSNPTAYLLEEAQRVYPDRGVASIVSIGSSHPKVVKVEEANLWRALILGRSTMARVIDAAYEMAEGSERTAEEMERRFANVDSVYYRLNVQQGAQGIEADEWGRMSEVAAHTRAYLTQGTMQPRLDSLIEAVSNRPTVLRTAQMGGRVARAFKLEPAQNTVQICPLPSTRFTGRERHTRMVRTYFTRGAEGRYVFVLYGLGGSGKTQIALKCVEQPELKERFANVLFVDASSDDTIRTTLATIALDKGLGKSHNDMLAWISRNSRGCLLMLDNADDPTVNLQVYFPQSADYSVLITTRCPEFVTLADGESAACNVSGLEDQDAVELLLKAARLSLDALNEVDQRTMYQMLKSFDYLELAIVQSGAYIWKMMQISLSEYWERFSTRQQMIPEGNAVPRLGLDGYSRSVYTTWNLSLNQLGPPTQHLLLMVSFLHRDEILEETFIRAARNVKEYKLAIVSASNQPVIEVVQQVTQFLSHSADDGQSNDAFSSYFGELMSFSLITYNQVSRAYSLHPLVRAWAQAAAFRQNISLDHSALLLGLSIDWGEGHTDYAYKRRILPHVDLVAGQTRVCDLDFADRYAEVYRSVGQSQNEAALWERAIAVWKQQLGENHPKTLASMSSLAVAYQKLGRLAAARALQETTLAAQIRILGEDHPDALKTKHKLGWAIFEQGQPAEAGALHESALVARKQVLGQNHPDTLESMDDLAASLIRQGRLTEAETLRVEALAIRKRTLGEAHVDTLEGMDNLAGTYQEQGRLDEAEALYAAVVATRNMHNLASTYQEQGRLDEAEALYGTVVATEKRVLGEDHPHTLISMNHLAATYYLQDRFVEAEALFIAVLASRRRVLGSTHPHTITSMQWLEDVYSKLGKATERDALLSERAAI